MMTFNSWEDYMPSFGWQYKARGEAYIQNAKL